MAGLTDFVIITVVMVFIIELLKLIAYAIPFAPEVILMVGFGWFMLPFIAITFGNLNLPGTDLLALMGNTFVPQERALMFGLFGLAIFTRRLLSKGVEGKTGLQLLVWSVYLFQLMVATLVTAYIIIGHSAMFFPDLIKYQILGNALVQLVATYSAALNIITYIIAMWLNKEDVGNPKMMIGHILGGFAMALISILQVYSVPVSAGLAGIATNFKLF